MTSVRAGGRISTWVGWWRKKEIIQPDNFFTDGAKATYSYNKWFEQTNGLRASSQQIAQPASHGTRSTILDSQTAKNVTLATSEPIATTARTIRPEAPQSTERAKQAAPGVIPIVQQQSCANRDQANANTDRATATQRQATSHHMQATTQHIQATTDPLNTTTDGARAKTASHEDVRVHLSLKQS